MNLYSLSGHTTGTIPKTQNSGSHLSQLSAPLFTEDRYSTSTDNDQDNCDAEVSMITRW